MGSGRITAPLAPTHKIPFTLRFQRLLFDEAECIGSVPAHCGDPEVGRLVMRCMAAATKERPTARQIVEGLSTSASAAAATHAGSRDAMTDVAMRVSTIKDRIRQLPA